MQTPKAVQKVFIFCYAGYKKTNVIWNYLNIFINNVHLFLFNDSGLSQRQISDSTPKEADIFSLESCLKDCFQILSFCLLSYLWNVLGIETNENTQVLRMEYVKKYPILTILLCFGFLLHIMPLYWNTRE